MEEFTGVQNKGLLWNLLSEGGIFNGIAGENVDLVREKLDQSVAETWERQLEGEGLKDLNKRVCQMMLVATERMREQPRGVGMGIRPDDINFADETEEPLIGLDQALEELQARRTHELNRGFATQNASDGPAWIQEVQVPDKHIKIGEEAALDDANIRVLNDNKKVRFSEDTEDETSTEADNFIGRLKVIAPPSDEEYLSRLSALEKGQNTIIAMLSQLIAHTR